jgi:cytochrome c-type biogenesis protein CcmF
MIILIFIISGIDNSLNQANIIRYLGNFTIGGLIVLNIFDLVMVIGKKNNYPFVSILNFILSLFLFLLIELLFWGNIFENIYVWSYSSVDTPLIYKSVAIWAGEAGSIITWMIMNSFMILIYRLKTDKIESKLFFYSIILSIAISVIFFIIIALKTPFKIADIPEFAPNGLGLNPLLHSPFMVWHPLFVFLGYATFLIPFTISVIKLFKSEWNLRNPHQKLFLDFSLKFGWLNFTLAIGLGAYWASQSLSWGRFWGWDPVETVSLLPWIFITAYFHSISFKKEKKKIPEIIIVSTFLSVVFSTLITRGGGFNSLHAFTGSADLLFPVIIVGVLLVISGLFLIFNSFDMMVESFPNVNKIVDYGSFLSFILLAFVLIFGLIVSPITLLLSLYFNTVPLYLNINYYSTGALVPAVLIGISLVFCSLRGIVQKKIILIIAVVSLLVQTLISYLLKITTGTWINPFIAIFIISIISAIIPLIKHFSFAKGYGHFFKVNGRHILHLAISFILVGTLLEDGIIQTIVYFSGFILSILGIIPSILISLIRKTESGK